MTRPELLPQRLRDFAIRRRQFLMFCAVGGSGVLVNMVVFHSTLWIWGSQTGSVNRLAANVAVSVAWLVSVASNFVLNDLVTFTAPEAGFQSTRQRRMLRYYAAALTGFALQFGIFNAVEWLLPRLGPACAPHPGLLSSLCEALVTHHYGVSNLTGIAAGTVSNYLLSRTWVFR